MTNTETLTFGQAVLHTNRKGDVTNGVVVEAPHANNLGVMWTRVRFEDGPAAGSDLPVKVSQLTAKN